MSNNDFIILFVIVILATFTIVKFFNVSKWLASKPFKSIWLIWNGLSIFFWWFCLSQVPPQVPIAETAAIVLAINFLLITFIISVKSYLFALIYYTVLFSLALLEPQSHFIVIAVLFVVYWLGVFINARILDSLYTKNLNNNTVAGLD